MKDEELVKIFKEVNDYLSPLQTPTEQAIYNYLLRWSYFETGKNIIQIGERTIAKEVSKPAKGRLSKSKGLNPSTVRDCIRNLVKMGHLEISDIHHKGKVYIIKIPSEIKQSLELKGIKDKTPKNDLSEDYYINPINRKIIFERDKSKCYYCGQKVTEHNATLDHKIPQSKGGNNSKENLVVCCFECNSIKSGKTLEEVAPKLLERLKNKNK